MTQPGTGGPVNVLGDAALGRNVPHEQEQRYRAQRIARAYIEQPSTDGVQGNQRAADKGKTERAGEQ